MPRTSVPVVLTAALVVNVAVALMAELTLVVGAMTPGRTPGPCLVSWMRIATSTLIEGLSHRRSPGEKETEHQH